MERHSEKFDAIVSLGGFCGTAIQLRARGLRPFSLPFDWLFMESPETIVYLTKAFERGFDDFCLKENLVDLPWDGHAGVAKYRYRDRLSGYGFIHHFHHSLEAGGWEETHPVLMRRILRMLSLFQPNRRILLILAMPFEFDLGLAANLLETLRRVYPQTEFQMQIVQLSANLPKGVLGETVEDTRFYGVVRYARPRDDYDINRPSSEWRFLDTIQLTGEGKKKIKGVAKLIYRLWKWSSKYLLTKGYRCWGIRFTA